MNTEALFLFLILLLGLVLCSFLGGNCGKEGLENNGNSTVYTGPNGATATLSTDASGVNIITLTQTSGSQTIIFTQSSSNNNLYTNPFGFSATVSGNTIVFATPNNGPTQTFTASQPSSSSSSSSSTPQQTPYDNYNHYTGANGNSVTSTQYYGSTGYQTQQSPYAMAFTGPYGNTAYYAQGPNGNTVAGTTSSGNGNSAYYDSLPPGIPASQIPPGQEDLYILKSEVVPPVCPACPTSAACPRQEKCPPCPACARCPEPAFECKKVPNYSAINNDYLPSPVLNDFSQFGM